MLQKLVRVVLLPRTLAEIIQASIAAVMVVTLSLEISLRLAAVAVVVCMN